MTNRTQLALTCCISLITKSTRTFFISKMLDIIYNVLNVYLCEDSIILFHSQANKKNVGARSNISCLSISRERVFHRFRRCNICISPLSFSRFARQPSEPNGLPMHALHALLELFSPLLAAALALAPYAV